MTTYKKDDPARWNNSTATAKTTPPLPVESGCWLKGLESDQGHYEPQATMRNCS
ncbi:hypothetical protein L208DRAFT_1416751 [Tricholoma matsutake]|nr:hypothetical protein L208DRAFT_1416751 [Tricholoma matsutake 945]